MTRPYDLYGDWSPSKTGIMRFIIVYFSIIVGCEYGDKAEWCTTLAAGDCYLNNAVCCDKCKQYETNDQGKVY